MSSPQSPNVILVVTDQQRYDANSGHGGLARTPNLDRLARTGADFGGFFSNAPVCVPSRCSIFSGQYPLNHGVLENNKRLSATSPLLSSCFKQAGYSIGYFGKNHLIEEDDPRKGDFDAFDSCKSTDDPNLASTNEAYQAYRAERQKRLAQVASWASADFHDFPEELTNSYLIRKQAVSFLEKQAETNTPFYLTLSFEDPHVPHVAPSRFAGHHRIEEMPIPQYPENVFEGKASRFAIKRKAQGAELATDADKQRYLSVYHSMVSWIDENLGAVFGRLEELNLRDNTIIAFTSDHGDFAFHWGMCKKDLCLADHLLHVPFILSWPGKIPAQTIARNATLAESVDIAPTLLDFAGLPIPEACDGQSLKPLLLGDTVKHKDFVYSQIGYLDMKNPYKDYDSFIAEWKKASLSDAPHPLKWTAPFNIPCDHSQAVRTLEWKYIWYHDGHEELYDARNDPEEFHSLASVSKYQSKLEEMRQLLRSRSANYSSPKA